MAVHSTSDDFWQTTARSTIRERSKAIFNQELLSDVKFVVQDSRRGRKSKSIPAHKFVLAISSPVFYAMFYGQLAETKDYVEISDCEYESLLELFRFIYSDEVNLNPNNVMHLLYLSKKYMLSSLADKCCAYLQENVDASNVFAVLPDVQKYDESDLLDHCWKVIEKETDHAVKSDCFVAIERSVLEELVKKDSLNIKEVELFKAVDRWAEKECEKHGLVAEGHVKRRMLGERIVKGIRFPVMEQKEIADVVLHCGVLTHKETCDMVKYFNSVLNTSVGFSEGKRDAPLQRVSRFTSVVWNDLGWNHSSSYNDMIYFSVDKNINLHAVRLFGSENNEYSVTIIVKDVNGDVIATEKGNFLCKHMQSDLTGDYQGFDVPFEPPVTVGTNAEYNLIAFVTGPPSWHGVCGLSSVEHSGVKFFFADFMDVTSKEGQLSELLFTLD